MESKSTTQKHDKRSKPNKKDSSKQQQVKLASSDKPVQPKSHIVDIPTASNPEPAKPEPKDQKPVDPKITVADVADQKLMQPTVTTCNPDLIDDESLAANLARLTTPTGSIIYLIGTAHFSLKSAEDVRRVISTVKPSSVMLELCWERAFMLTLDEASLLEQNKTLTFDKIRSAIAEKGLVQGLIYIMFIKMSANVTEKLGLAPGYEFRVGATEAGKLQNCSIILADRLLKTTIARAVASISLWQKVKLIYQVLMNDVSINQEDIERCKDKDILEQLLLELGGEFPGLKRVLLDERNLCLAHAIWNWTTSEELHVGPQRVVAVVGAGHVAGIVEHWGKTNHDEVDELHKMPKTSKTRRVVTKTIKYCSFALLLYVGYRMITPSSIQNAVQEKLMGNTSNS